MIGNMPLNVLLINFFSFTEMPTNNFVENSFWNFDALFTPQRHPARDAQDTFFLSDPEKTTKFPMDYLEKVKQVHSTGAFGSIGYQYDWHLEETQKNVLRTHTTAVSTRMLYKLAQEVCFDVDEVISEKHSVFSFELETIQSSEILLDRQSLSK